jgi:hypothetical protein
MDNFSGVRKSEVSSQHHQSPMNPQFTWLPKPLTPMVSDQFHQDHCERSGAMAVSQSG